MIEFIVSEIPNLVIYYTIAVTVASWIVKLTPQLPETHWLKSTVRFLGRYVAVNRTSDDKIVVKIKRKD